ncbi:GNAT family N-acetyltransferase [Kribbella solani]|uniref:GNAT family N-acetyltransferase n=1 Tax=Kribbella solani TaxID=236067 RepID=UPI0029A3E4FE|nr:GNAT family N-acetyltransferase [Kribbella solani]MDX2968823.1 GNAT family N-acetyltransferase [Kribbella solani]MDX3000532.1 GNAT family N-acetyltransferase [Kribbella solani]
MTVYLETSRLVLRRFTPDDLDLLVELDSDPEVMRYLTGEPTPRAEVADVVLPEILKVYAEHPRLGTFKAESAEGFIGWFGLQPTDELGTAGVGYRLNRAAWGKGYATEGTKALIAHAFTELGMERVVADTMAVNHRSRAVLRRSGLRFLKVYHEHFDDPLPGTEFGEVLYGVDRATWETGRHG